MKNFIFTFILILVLSPVVLEGQSNNFNNDIINENIVKRYIDYTHNDNFDTYIIEYKDGSKKKISLNRNRGFKYEYIDSVNVIFQFDVANIEFLLLNDSIRISNDWGSNLPVTQINDSTFQFFPPRGIYNLKFELWGYPQRFVFKENINIISDTTFNFYITDANHCIKFNGLDENGVPLSQYPDSEPILALIIPNRRYDSFNMLIDSLLVSDMTGWIYLSSQHFNLSLGAVDYIYSVRFPVIKTLFTDTILTNNPLNFFIQDINIEFPLNSNPNLIYINDAVRYDPFGGGSGGGSVIYASSSWDGKLFINEEPDSFYVHSIRLEAEINDSTNFRQQYIDLNDYRIYDNQIGSFLGWTPSPITYLSHSEDTLIYGTTPIFSNALHLNNLDQINQIGIYSNFFGSINEIRYYDRFVSQLSIYDSLNNLIYDGILDEFDTLTVFPGVYNAQIVNENYHINSIGGRGTLNTFFDLNKLDANPPLLTSLKILNSDGKQRDVIWSNENAIIEFSAADFIILDTLINGYTSSVFQYKKILSDSTKLWIKQENDTNWIAIPVNEIMEDINLIKLESKYSAIDRRGLRFFPAGCIYRAELNMINNWGDVGLDLKLEVMDQSGNSTEWILEPACFVNYRAPNNIGDSKNHVKSFALKQNYPNPFNPETKIEYQLQKSSRINLSIYNCAGQLIETLVNSHQKSGKYSINWNAKGVSSGVYFYRISAISGNENYTDVKKCIVLK